MRITVKGGTCFLTKDKLDQSDIETIKVQKPDRLLLQDLFSKLPQMKKLQKLNFSDFALQNEEIRKLSNVLKQIKGSKLNIKFSRETYDSYQEDVDKLKSENKFITVCIKGGFVKIKKSISQDSFSLKKSGDSVHLDWSAQYYTDKAFQSKEEPYETVKKVIEVHWQNNPGTCLDFGCGDGKDALWLLREGWRVFGNDANEDSLNMLRNNALRILPPKLLQEKLITLNTEFIDLPQLTDDKGRPVEIDLLNASLTLPYRTPKEFPICWKKVVSLLKTGAYFTGHFFGPKHYRYPTGAMTFHTRADLEKLIEEHFKILSFVEIAEYAPCASNNMLFWHRFDVVAIKKHALIN